MRASGPRLRYRVGDGGFLSRAGAKVRTLRRLLRAIQFPPTRASLTNTAPSPMVHVQDNREWGMTCSRCLAFFMGGRRGVQQGGRSQQALRSLRTVVVRDVCRRVCLHISPEEVTHGRAQGPAWRWGNQAPHGPAASGRRCARGGRARRRAPDDAVRPRMPTAVQAERPGKRRLRHRLPPGNRCSSTHRCAGGGLCAPAEISTLSALPSDPVIAK